MIPAWTNDYVGGFKYDDRPTRTVQTTKSGTVTTTVGTTRHTVALATRGPHTNNPKDPSGWRRNSSYERRVMRFTAEPAEYTRVFRSGTQQVLTGFPVSTVDKRSHLLSYPMNSGYDCTSSDEVNRAVTECLLKLKDKKIDLGTALAESIKTVDMVAASAKTLWETLLAVKRGRIPKWARRGFNPSVSLSNSYLQFKYGWKPLMQDVYSAYELARDGLGRKTETFSASRSILESYESATEVLSWKDRRQVVQVQGKCKLWARIDSELYSNVSRVGLNNPLSLGWELVPFSFVVDWGIPVGNFLEALNASAGLTFVGGFTSVRAVGSVSGELQIPADATGHGTKALYEFFSFSRTALTGFPKPIPYAKSPFSTSNVESALALWRQLR